jgi:hypothetical protein
MKLFLTKRAPLAFAAFFAAAAMVSCDDDPTGPSATPAAVAASTSPPATAQVATAVAGPAVLVTGEDGTPAPGVLVNFSVTGGGGALQFPIATTNEQGIASSGAWQIGPTVGVNTAAATVEGLTPVTFTLTSEPGPASRISVNAGNSQTGPANTALPTPLSVRVSDAGGNAKPGETVTFSVLTGDGSIASPTTTTNAQGIATSGAWTIGPCRNQTARAQSGTFTVTFTGGATGQPSIAPGGAAVGSLDATDCNINGAFADEYDMTTAAEAVDISLTSAAFDALLNVSNGAATTPIATNDNTTGTNSFVRLIALANRKTVTATSATAGATGAYALSVVAASSDVTDCTPTFIETGVSTTQTLTTTDCETHNGVNADAFTVYIPVGGNVRIAMSSNPIDALIELYSPTGTRLVQRDNLGVSASSEVITFTATTAGFYKIVATAYGLVFDDAYGAEYGAYTFSVTVP